MCPVLPNNKSNQCLFLNLHRRGVNNDFHGTASSSQSGDPVDSDKDVFEALRQYTHTLTTKNITYWNRSDTPATSNLSSVARVLLKIKYFIVQLMHTNKIVELLKTN